MSEHFKASELVYPEIYVIYGERASRWINPKIFDVLEYLREKFGAPIRINGDGQTERGLRRFDTETGAKYSGHKYGRCVDINVDGLTSDQVWDKITGDFADDLKTLGLTTVEDKTLTPTWTHLSVENMDGWNFREINGIKIIDEK